MVSKPNPYGKILEDAVLSATGEELTLMLYEGGIKFCNQAMVALEKKDIEKANMHLQRVQEILREFMLTLNHDYPISAQFSALYDYMHRRAMEANTKKDPAILNEVLSMFRSMRDTWKEAMKASRAG